MDELIKWLDENEIDEIFDDVFWLYAIIMTESSGNPKAESPYARGLMQLSKIALKDVNKKFGTDFKYDDMFDPLSNVKAGALYLTLLKNRIRKLGLDPSRFIVSVAWNWGLGNLLKWMRQKADNSIIDESLPTETKAHAIDVEWYYQNCVRGRKNGSRLL